MNFTPELVKDFQEFLPVFEEQGITSKEILLSLDRPAVDAMLPKIEPRVMFWKKLEALKNADLVQSRLEKPNQVNLQATSSIEDETQTLLLEMEDTFGEKFIIEECSSVDPLTEKHLVEPKQSTIERKEKTRPIIPLPEFSKVVQPILEGEELSRKDHAQLSAILKVELISYLNRENLICNGNTSTLRWEYRNLGEALALKYPKMMWDLPSKRKKKIPSANAPIYSVFIRRLTERRKMQRLRQKAKEKRESPFTVNVVKEIEFEISAEDALSELKSVIPEAVSNCTNNARIKELLKISYPIRQHDEIAELPSYMRTHSMLETEVELRLQSTFSEMVTKLKVALLKMSSSFSIPATVVEMEKLMQPKRATWSSITMGEYSSEQERPGPSIFYGDNKVLL